MARDMTQQKLCAGHVHVIPAFERVIHGIRFHDGIFAEEGSYEKLEPGGGRARAPCIDRAAVFADEPGGIDDVIEMAMRQEKRRDPRLPARHPTGHSGGRIDGHGAVRSGKEIAVGGGEAAGVSVDGGHETTIYKLLRKAMDNWPAYRRFAGLLSPSPIHPRIQMNPSHVSRSQSFFFRTLPVLAAAASCFGFPSCSTAQEGKTNFGAVAYAVVGMLQDFHYSGAEFDDRMARKTLGNYLDTLDYNRLYFTQPEIDGWRAKYEHEMVDQLHIYNRIDAAHEIFTAYRKHVEERVGKVKALIESGKLNFESDESAQISRNKLTVWPADEAELDELWRKEIVREILQERIYRLHAERKKKEKEKDPAAKKEEAGKVEARTPDTPEQKVLKRYERILTTLKETDEEDVTNYFLSAVAASFDPHSEYLSAPEEEDFRMDMKKELIGIGAVLQAKEGGAEIKSVVPKGPADKSGAVKIGDIIMGVAQGDGEMEDVEGFKLRKIVEKIRGEAGSVVRLKIQPADDPAITREVSITRERVELKDTLAKGELIEIQNTQSGIPAPGATPQKIGWLTLDSFYADMEKRDGRSATADVKKILGRLSKEGIKGLVIDLRGNGGGSLEEAIKLTSLFVKRGTPVVQQRNNRDQKEARKTKDIPLYEGPLVVMTDRASASASEIFAAALQDTGRAVIVGDQSTFGKGTVQTLADVKEHMPVFADKDRAGSLKVTIAKFYRINGDTTQFEGVTPDIDLPSRYDAMEVGERYLKDPLPKDRISALPFEMAAGHPLPVDELEKRSDQRVKHNPDFAFINDYVTRTKNIIKNNVLSLNEKTRLAEDTANEERNRAYKEDRKKRVAEANRNGDPYRVFPVTLENAGDVALKLDSEVKKEEQSTARAVLEEDDDTVTDSEETFPHGFDPAKLEAISIMQDLVALSKPAAQKETVRRD